MRGKKPGKRKREEESYSVFFLELSHNLCRCNSLSYRFLTPSIGIYSDSRWTRAWVLLALRVAFDSKQMLYVTPLFLVHCCRPLLSSATGLATLKGRWDRSDETAEKNESVCADFRRRFDTSY